MRAMLESDDIPAACAVDHLISFERPKAEPPTLSVCLVLYATVY